MATMTKRERVLRTVRFEGTDRVPLYDILENDATIEHYAGQPLTVENGTWVKGLAIGRTLDCGLTWIGSIERSPGLRCLREDGTTLDAAAGYDHFGGAG